MAKSLRDLANHNKKILRSQSGQVLPLVLVAMAIGIAVISPFLTQASTTVLTSRSYGSTATDQYSADAGVEYTIYCLTNNIDRILDRMKLKNPETNVQHYPPSDLTVNDVTQHNTNITVTEHFPTTSFSLVSSVSSPTGNPTWTDPWNEPNKIFYYTLEFYDENQGGILLQQVTITLPSGFSYVALRPSENDLGTLLDKPPYYRKGSWIFDWNQTKPEITATSKFLIIEVRGTFPNPGTYQFYTETKAQGSHAPDPTTFFNVGAGAEPAPYVEGDYFTIVSEVNKPTMTTTITAVVGTDYKIISWVVEKVTP